MAHTIYENFILQNKIKEMLDTKLAVSPFFTHDNSLQETAGMIKKVSTYTATGDVRDVGMGEGNQASDDVEVSFTTKQYEVKFVQGRFNYFDEEAMQDPMLIDVGLKKMSANMINDLTKKFYAELAKATKTIPYQVGTGIDFNVVADAIAEFGEEETGLFMLINPQQKAEIRKYLEAHLKYVDAYASKGYVASVCNVPIYTSKCVPEGQAYMATKEAVTVFTKKDVETEQERECNTRLNTVFGRRCNLVALTDDTKVVKLVRTTPTKSTK